MTTLDRVAACPDPLRRRGWGILLGYAGGRVLVTTEVRGLPGGDVGVLAPGGEWVRLPPSRDVVLTLWRGDEVAGRVSPAGRSAPDPERPGRWLAETFEGEVLRGFRQRIEAETELEIRWLGVQCP